MKLLFVNILIFMLTLGAIQAHPVHISVCNITFNEENRSFDISIKLFKDDFTSVIHRNYQHYIDLNSTCFSKKDLQAMDQYISAHFAIITDKKSTDKMKIKNAEIKDDAIWVYLQVMVKGHIESLAIKNDLMNDYFPDQKNLLIIKYKDKEQGFSLDKKNTLIQIAQK